LFVIIIVIIIIIIIIIISIHLVVPVSVETMGSWDVDSINFVSTIGKKLTEVSGDPLVTSYLLLLLLLLLFIMDDIVLIAPTTNVPWVRQ